MAKAPLANFRILDLSTSIAGPFCTKLFADYGADVIKVEPVSTGDEARRTGPFFDDDPHLEKSLLFLYLNCNKRGLTLNVESAFGRRLLLELVKRVDAVVESYPPGYLAGLGVGFDQLTAVNQRLVMTSITPFGQTGPYRDFAGSHLLYEAMGGVMYTSGGYDREPLGHGHPQSLYIGGITAAYATSGALFASAMDGQGQHIDLSLMEGVAAHHMQPPTKYIYTGAIERRAPKEETGSPKAGAHFQGIVPVKDGYVGATFQRGTQRPGNFSEYLELLGCSDVDNPKFAEPDPSGQFSKEKDELLLSVLSEWKKFDYFNLAASNSWVAAVVQTSEDLANCPQLAERGFYTEADHPVIGKIRMPGEIYKLPEGSYSLRLPAPLLGQHNREIYCGELGHEPEDLVLLRQQGVI